MCTKDLTSKLNMCDMTCLGEDYASLSTYT